MNWNERSNPCAYELYARAMAWAETDCWCCSATRGMLVGVLIGALAALLISAMYAAAFTLAVAGIPFVMVLLWVARHLWTDDEALEGGESSEPKPSGNDDGK